MTAPTHDLDMQHPAVLALLDDERHFDATRLPCPDWCDRTCETTAHFGNAVFHTSTEALVPSTNVVGSDDADAPRTETLIPTRSAYTDPDPDAAVIVRTVRYEALREATIATVDLDVSGAEGALPECASFSARQARALIAALTEAVERIDPNGGAR